MKPKIVPCSLAFLALVALTSCGTADDEASTVQAIDTSICVVGCVHRSNWVTQLTLQTPIGARQVSAVSDSAISTRLDGSLYYQLWPRLNAGDNFRCTFDVAAVSGWLLDSVTAQRWPNARQPDLGYVSSGAGSCVWSIRLPPFGNTFTATFVVPFGAWRVARYYDPVQRGVVGSVEGLEVWNLPAQVSQSLYSLEILGS